VFYGQPLSEGNRKLWAQRKVGEAVKETTDRIPDETRSKGSTMVKTRLIRI